MESVALRVRIPSLRLVVVGLAVATCLRSSASEGSRMKLKVELPPTWQRVPNDGPATFVRSGGERCLLQVSWTEFKEGQPPNPDAAKLVEGAVWLGRRSGLTEQVSSNSGSCSFGTMGTAVFRSQQFQRAQIWFLSDSRNFIHATLLCSKEPSAGELAEAEAIVNALGLGPEASKR